MQGLLDVRKRPCAGMTLVEVMTAMVILFFVLWGTIAFVTGGRVRSVHSGQRRTASQLAAECLETARGQGFAAIQSGTGTASLDDTTYAWSMSVADSVADPADGDSVYKLIEVTVDWPTSRGQPVTLRSAVAP